jgi:beta-phosphoglucomutase-like phosphatase (HAD superfamily)
MLGVDPSRCAVVEDALPGIEAGMAAGMTVFALGIDDGWSRGRVRKIRTLADISPWLSSAA